MPDLRKSTLAEELDFRKLIGDSTDETLGLLQTESSPLNNWQCQQLGQKLKDVKHLLETHTEDRSSGPLKELYRITKEAEDLVRQCCSQPWMRAAIAQADNGEAFCEVLYDLEWCMTLLQAAAKSHRRGTKSKVQLAKRLTEIRLVNADASLKDRGELEVRLKGAIQEGSQLSHDERTLAKYLLARLSDAKASKVVDQAKTDRGECLGSGTYGVVYKISWLGETYAEKVFDVSSVEKGEGLRKSFEREGRVLQSLRHRNVVQLIDHYSNDTECSLVMEYMSRGDLRTLINSARFSSTAVRPPFSLPVAVDILRQMATGMQYMHAKRVAHRDIKAGNVLVNMVKSSGYFEAEHLRAFGGYMSVKLADFGMAKVKQEGSMSRNATTSNGVVGTTRYKAPELFDHPDPASVDPFAADVYSYGITCSEVVTGLFPFANVADEEVRTRVTEMGERPDLPEIVCPPALAFLISKCWSTVPADRPCAADIVRFLHDFKASFLLQAEFDYRSWSWNFNPDSIDMNDLSSLDDDVPENVGGSPVSKLFLRAKDSVASWLFGGNIGSSAPSSSTSPSTVEITSKDVEITSNDLETRQFPFEKLQAATNNFGAKDRAKVYIGEGPFAKIFRGSFAGELKQAAVRKLVFAENSDSKVFHERVSVMATIKHPNLINLVGYCENEGHFYLVHQFIDSPGTIGTVLLGYSKPEGHPLRDVKWIERYQIAVGVGQALAHLHDDLNPPVIHGNLTTRSIMLEEPDLNPKLFDFGMKFLFPEKDVDNLDLKYPTFRDEKKQWTAPEHRASGDIEKTGASDMYSFGILMLVLVSGRRVIKDKVHIIDVACNIYDEGEVLNFLDKKVPGGYFVPSEEVMLIMQVALLCLQEDAQRRPKASEAVQMLLREVAIAPDRFSNITDRIKLRSLID